LTEAYPKKYWERERTGRRMYSKISIIKSANKFNNLKRTNNEDL
jgi:hypothetical protein